MKNWRQRRSNAGRSGEEQEAPAFVPIDVRSLSMGGGPGSRWRNQRGGGFLRGTRNTNVDQPDAGDDEYDLAAPGSAPSSSPADDLVIDSSRLSVTKHFRRRSVDCGEEEQPQTRASYASLKDVVSTVKLNTVTRFLLPKADMRSLASKVNALGSSGSRWELVYHSDVDKFNIRVFQKRVTRIEGILIVVRDERTNIFGAFTQDSWDTTSGYYGSDDCFLFRASPHPLEIYKATKENECFQLCRHDHIALGGGSSFGLFLHNGLRTGASGASETFNNPALSGEEGKKGFMVDTVEAWRLVPRA